MEDDLECRERSWKKDESGDWLMTTCSHVLKNKVDMEDPLLKGKMGEVGTRGQGKLLLVELADIILMTFFLKKKLLNVIKKLKISRTKGLNYLTQGFPTDSRKSRVGTHIFSLLILVSF